MTTRKRKAPPPSRAHKPPKAPPRAHRIPGTADAAPSPYHLAHPAEAGGGRIIAPGASSPLLAVVGDHPVSIAHALAAWTREQDRLANSAWRRPGGLASMGGL